MEELKLIKIKDHYVRLKIIFEKTIELIDKHKTDEISIEALFLAKMFNPC